MTDRQVIAKTLSDYLRLQLLWVGLLCLLTGFTLFVLFTWHSMESTSTHLMRMEAESILRLQRIDSNYQLPQTASFGAYSHWGEIPINERRLFKKRPDVNEIAETSRPLYGGVEYIYLLHYHNKHDQTLWLMSRHAEEEIADLLESLFDASMGYALWFVVLIELMLFLVFYWLIRQTTKPLSILSAWAKKLVDSPHKAIKPGFHIKELNDLAEQLKIGVDEVQAFNNREREFLQTASHELRTPLATMQASLDTLDLITEDRQRPALNRALKSSHYMRQLTSTLLWLARQDKDEHRQEPELQSFDMAELINEQLLRHAYLSDEKLIDVLFESEPCPVCLELDLVQIVIANLIRNALQHCASGQVVIDVDTTQFAIRNSVLSGGVSKAESFGLGIALVERICERQKWQFNYRCDQSEASALFIWTL